MPPLTEYLKTTFIRKFLPFVLNLEEGYRRFIDKFNQHQFDTPEVVRCDNSGLRFGRQATTVLCAAASWVLHLVKLPIAMTVKSYRAVTQTHTTGALLTPLEQHNMLQPLAAEASLPGTELVSMSDTRRPSTQKVTEEIGGMNPHSAEEGYEGNESHEWHLLTAPDVVEQISSGLTRPRSPGAY
jgi:hypothetical protein